MKSEVCGSPENFFLWPEAFLLSSGGMPAEARVTKMWTQQKGLIPLLFLFFGAYFLYDGFIGYPRSDERFQTHQALKDQPGAWEKLCAEKGWKTEPPEKFLGPSKYQEQFWFGSLTALVGLISLIYWQRQRKTVIRNDETGISTDRPLVIPYTSITRVDKRVWKDKGYAYIYFQEGSRLGKLTLDDAKHDPKALDIILAETVAKVGPNTTIDEPPAAPPPTSPPAPLAT